MSDENRSTENKVTATAAGPIGQADGDDGETSRTRGASGQPMPMQAWRPVPDRSLSGESVGAFKTGDDANIRPNAAARHREELAQSSRIDIAPYTDHKRPADEEDVRRSSNPIYGNYPGDIWRSHTRSGGDQSLVRSSGRVTGRNNCEKPKKS